MIRYLSDQDGEIVFVLQSHHKLHEQEHLPQEPAPIVGFKHKLKHGENGLYWVSDRCELSLEEQLALATQRVAILEKMVNLNDTFGDLPKNPSESLIPGDTPSILPDNVDGITVPTPMGVDESTDLPSDLPEELLDDLGI